MNHRLNLALKSLPERIANLMLLYLHNSLGEAERQELKEWIMASDENIEIFKELTDVDQIAFTGKYVYHDGSDSWLIIGDLKIPLTSRNS